MAVYMKKTIQLSQLAQNIIQQIPHGLMILDENADVQFYNKKLSKLFDNRINEDMYKYGNIFNCEIVHNSSDLCGCNKVCRNCELRNAFLEVKKTKEIVEKINYQRAYVQNNEAVLKCFEVSIAPFEDQDRELYVLTFNDTTTQMAYLHELELEISIHDERNQLWKIRFHENVMQWLSTKAYLNNYAYMLHITINTTNNDQAHKYFGYLINHKNYKELICRINLNELLVYFPTGNENEIERFYTLLSNFDYEEYGMSGTHQKKLAKFILDDEKINRINKEDDMHIKYFNALSEFLANEEDYQEIVLE